MKLKTFWPKGKLLIMSNFTFGLNIFKSCLLLLRQNASAGGKIVIFETMHLSLSIPLGKRIIVEYSGVYVERRPLKVSGSTPVLSGFYIGYFLRTNSAST